jgi:hypothetical protein
MELKIFVGYNPNLLKSVLLLALAVSGNFVGNTLGCSTQFHMTNNMYVKHMLLIFMVFFTLNYSTTENENPSYQIFRAIMIWVCYLLFTKQNITFTILSAGILLLTYIVDTFSIYYEKKSEDKNLGEKDKNDNKEISELLKTFRTFSFLSGILAIIIGFFIYYGEKNTEYGNEFNPLTFIFGKTKCKGLI